MGDMSDLIEDQRMQEESEADYARLAQRASVLGDFTPRTPRWRNALGEEVNLDDIDREYALAILQHYTLNCGLRGRTHDDMRNDPLVEKLRDVVLNGREKDASDKWRAHRYNIKCRFRKLPFEAR